MKCRGVGVEANDIYRAGPAQVFHLAGLLGNEGGPNPGVAKRGGGTHLATGFQGSGRKRMIWVSPPRRPLHGGRL